jgi:uncharacterized membrane protein (Fun14 family)
MRKRPSRRWTRETHGLLFLLPSAAGLGFVTLQALQYTGYVQVDHRRVREDFMKRLDFNEDGVVDQRDARHAYQKVVSVLQFGLPAGSGFAAGFVGGLRSG